MSPKNFETLRQIVNELHAFANLQDMAESTSVSIASLATQLSRLANSIPKTMGSENSIPREAVEDRCAGISGPLAAALGKQLTPSTEELVERLHATMEQLAIRSKHDGDHNARLASIGAKMDQFEQFCRGPIADGDLIAKDVRDRLLRQQLIVRENGFNMLSADGLRFATALGLIHT
jgi:hypothetical protein